MKYVVNCALLRSSIRSRCSLSGSFAARVSASFSSISKAITAARSWRSRSGVLFSIVSSFATLFLAEFVDEGKFGHSAAFARLALAKIAKPFLSRRHLGIILSQEVTGDPPSQKDQA